MYTDGTTVNKRPVFEFNRGVRDWQFGSCVFNLSDNDDTQNRTPEKINVYINYRKQVNTAYFDNFSLIKEPVPTYEYDEDGNLVSAVQNAENKSALTYDSNNNLSSFTDEREAQYSYTYNTSGNKHQLKTATSNFTGLKYSYTYNDTGSVKSQTVNNSNASSAIATDFEYTAASGDIKAGAYLLKETNQRGFSTTYDYNLDNGQLNSVTMANDQVVSYAYKPNTNLLSSVTHSPKEISYTYDSTNTKLSAVNWNGFSYNFVYDVFGNLKQTKIGSTPLETNTYQSYNGKLAITTYGNGDYTSWHYNDLGLVTKVLKNDVTKYQWLYNSAGEAGIQYDFENDETHNYVFDSLGRLVRKIVDKKSTGENKYISEQTYDLSGNVTKITNAAKGLQVSASYEYDKENRPTKTTLSDCASFNYSYDSLNRLTGKSMEDTDMGITYGYLSSVRNVGTDSSLYKTNFLRTETIAGKTYRYNYDNLGRIITVYEQEPTKSEEYKIGYVPDRFGQIVRENNAHLNKSITYSYDAYGNLTYKKYYPFTTSTLGTVEKTVAYTYDSTWKDKLISYDGQTITYDSIGNPLTYRDSMSFTWNGREMASANINGTAVTYRYNSDGLRSYKKVGTTEHEYQYLEDKLVYEKNGNLQFHYRYDAFGNLAEIRRVNADGSVNMACAVCNSFGDVIELRYRSGGLYATYKYDTWGKLLGVYDVNGNAITSIYSLATQNPFRYRGYYYDTESGLYYLNGRYYDPEVCRFISPDSVSVATASLSSYYNKNLYAYCDNNPVIRKDTTGAYWETAFDAVSLGFSIAEVVANPSDLWAWAGLTGDFLDVVAPCIGGIGEAVRVAKASMKGADATVDAVSAAKKADNAVDGVSSAVRSKAVRNAWKNEYNDVLNGGSGVSRVWTESEIDELIVNGKVKGYHGHHMKSVKGYPKLAGNSNNIQFLTRYEHLAAHKGNWRNITHGRYDYRV